MSRSCTDAFLWFTELTFLCNDSRLSVAHLFLLFLWSRLTGPAWDRITNDFDTLCVFGVIQSMQSDYLVMLGSVFFFSCTAYIIQCSLKIFMPETVFVYLTFELMMPGRLISLILTLFFQIERSGCLSSLNKQHRKTSLRGKTFKTRFLCQVEHSCRL